MSARCWLQRRRNKYLRQYIRYIDRHPDRVLLIQDRFMLHGRDFLSQDGDIDFEPLPPYKRHEAFRIIPRGASDR